MPPQSPSPTADHGGQQQRQQRHGAGGFPSPSLHVANDGRVVHPLLERDWSGVFSLRYDF